MISVRLPARINLLGSPTDAVEGAYATISAAIPLHAGARLEPARDLRFQREGGRSVVFEPGLIANNQGFDLEAAAVNGLLRYAPEVRPYLQRHGASIVTWTEIPVASGLAGSSVLLLAILSALREHCQLDRWRYNDYVLAEIAQRIEEQDLGVVCGFADRYVPLFGDIAYLGYHGKLWHAPLREEPFVTYEKLGEHAPRLELCVVATGIQRNSGSVHGPMRERYLRQRRAGAGAMLPLARAIGETAWRGKIALLAGNLVEFGRQIDRNQSLIEEMMRHCGFETGAGKEIEALIAAARQAGALGAKLTGAGGGGSIFALPAPGMADRLVDSLRRAAHEIGLNRSNVYCLPLISHGLQVERH